MFLFSLFISLCTARRRALLLSAPRAVVSRAANAMTIAAICRMYTARYADHVSFSYTSARFYAAEARFAS